jgi:hypothetical protein
MLGNGCFRGKRTAPEPVLAGRDCVGNRRALDACPLKVPALLFTGPGRIEMAEIELPVRKHDDVVVEGVLTAISPGTELRCLEGVHEGKGLWPFIPGYSTVGRGVRFVVQGSYAAEVPLPCTPFFQREATVLFPRADGAADIRAALDLVSRKKLSLAGIVSEVAAPDDAVRVYDRLRARDPQLLTAAFRWRDGQRT